MTFHYYLRPCFYRKEFGNLTVFSVRIFTAIFQMNQAIDVCTTLTLTKVLQRILEIMTHPSRVTALFESRGILAARNNTPTHATAYHVGSGLYGVL